MTGLWAAVRRDDRRRRTGSELVEFALRLADAAGAVVRKYYRAPITVESKADASPVTAADREAEQVLRR